MQSYFRVGMIESNCENWLNIQGRDVCV